MQILATLGLATIMLMVVPASAQTAEHLAGQVTRIYPQSNGNIYFRLSGTCKTSTYFYFSTANDGGKAWYAMLLSAATTKQPVRIATNICDPAVDQPIHYLYQDF